MIKHLRRSLHELKLADPENLDEDFNEARKENKALIEKYNGRVEGMRARISSSSLLDTYDFDNDAVGSMVGVDLSGEMAKIANSKNCYTEPIVICDCDDYLKERESDSADVIVSADTYIYVGDIETSVRESARVLKDGGMLAFSIEVIADDASPEGFTLLESGRYGQSKRYVRELARKFGFDLEVEEDLVVRKEQTRDIEGCVYILEKTIRAV